MGQGENRKLKNHDFKYDFGGSSALEETNLNKQIEDDIKLQIINKYHRRIITVWRCCNKEMFCVKRKGKKQQHKLITKQKQATTSYNNNNQQHKLITKQKQ